MKNLSIKKQIKEALVYLKESSAFIYSVIIIFLISALFGFIYKENLSFIDEIIRELLEQTKDMNSIELVFFILQNNLQSALFSMALGIFLGVYPIISAILNGVIIGYVLSNSYEIAGITSWWRLLPHGIFELPAIFISFGLGAKIGLPLAKNFFKYYWKNNKLIVFIPPLISIITFASSIISKSLSKKPELHLLGSTPEISMLLLFISNLIFLYVIFALLTSTFNKKLRTTQKKILKKTLYNSANAFLIIVIPLLILAAIIEGLLIGFIR